jgi:hypothetical protein
MKTFTFTSALKCLPFMFILLICKSSFTQTYIDIEPGKIAEVIAEKYLNTGNQPGSEFKVAKINAVRASGRTIGYIIHYKPAGIVVIPILREINPLFAISGISTSAGSLSEQTHVESFYKEELERRYLAIIQKNVSAVSVQRNEKMWQQVLLASASFKK